MFDKALTMHLKVIRKNFRLALLHYIRIGGEGFENMNEYIPISLYQVQFCSYFTVINTVIIAGIENTLRKESWNSISFREKRSKSSN